MISERLYLVIHAPKEPPSGFEPKMPTPPPPEPKVRQFFGDVRNNPDYKAYQQEIADWRNADMAWTKLRDSQRRLQWPLFWADTILDAMDAHPRGTLRGLMP